MGLFAKAGQNRHTPLADVNRGNRPCAWGGWVAHISQQVMRISLFAKDYVMQIASHRRTLDATGFLSFAPLGTQVYLLDARRF